MKIHFLKSKSARNWDPSEMQFFMNILNDARSWPFHWTITTRPSEANWTVRLETHQQIMKETNDYDNNDIVGLSVTFMTRKPRETLFSFENWTNVPEALRPFQYTRIDYRTYLILHECGHALGLQHARCTGGPAPIMLQQTRGLSSGLQVCTKNLWPLASEMKYFE